MMKRIQEIELEIPADKAATIERARKMQADGWKALEAMSDGELEEWDAELQAAYVYQPGKHGSAGLNMPIHPHNQARLDALSAVVDEKGRRRQEYYARSRDTNNRAAYIIEAAELVARAAELVEHAYSLHVGWPNEVPDPPALDLGAASDSQLEKMAASCRRITDFAHASSDASKQAEAIGQLKGAAARAISAELQERAGRHAARVEAARALLEAIPAEQERRERARREDAARRTPEAMEQRIAELERQLAGSTEAAG